MCSGHLRRKHRRPGALGYSRAAALTDSVAPLLLFEGPSESRPEPYRRRGDEDLQGRRRNRMDRVRGAADERRIELGLSTARLSLGMVVLRIIHGKAAVVPGA